MASTIQWRAWSDDAFDDAAAHQKPILLSIVTAWSEECSVMDASVYDDQQVVALVCDRFIPIRVDSDARPDVNERYNMGGWPSTALLTPSGDVLTGGTYFGPAEMLALLTQTADVWRDRSHEIVSRAAGQPNAGADRVKSTPVVDRDDAYAWFKALIVDQFDADHGGFGRAPKLPHAAVLLVALAIAEDQSDRPINEMVEVSLDRISLLWDTANGGFFHYADAPDWTHPATEKTLEDHAALIALFVDAAIRLHSDEHRERAAELVRWVNSTLADQAHGGFFNSQAAVSRSIDRSMYVDRNASMITAQLRAALFFDDPWLRDFALKSLETVIVPGYIPGRGVAHEYTDRASVRGLLSDQILTASALIWAHAVTGRLPYSMLALELVQFAVRTMWDDHLGCFRDRGDDEARPRGLLSQAVHPFALNCEAVCVLDRLAVMTGDDSHRQRALSILSRFGAEFRQHGLFAAPYVLAAREVVTRSRPPGLELSHVDWDLKHG